MAEFIQGASSFFIPKVPLQLEYWKDVPGWEGIYEISNIGNCRRIKRSPDKMVTEKIGPYLKPQKNARCGYSQYFLCKGGKDKPLYAHVVVAVTFIGPCPDKAEVNHKDRNRANPRASNLEYLTRAENNRHFYAAKRAQGLGSNYTVLKIEDVKEIKRLQGECATRQLAERFNVSTGAIYGIHKGINWAWVEV